MGSKATENRGETGLVGDPILRKLPVLIFEARTKAASLCGTANSAEQ